jgi:hypothetical protein
MSHGLPSEVNAKVRTHTDARSLHFAIPSDIIEVPLVAP